MSNAKHAATYRAKQLSLRTAQTKRVEELEAALRAISYEADRENGGWVHLKRCIATQARQALEGGAKA